MRAIWMAAVAGVASISFSVAAIDDADAKRRGGYSFKPKRSRSRATYAYGGGGAASYYANCSAARAAGAAPVRAGQPGYSRRLDRDGDGVGCE